MYCALVYIKHYATRMLENNAYVQSLLIDFSEVFDRVNHVILVKKLSNLQLASSIFNWLISFLSGIKSGPQTIKLSIVQGSGLSPTLYNF